MPFQGFNRPEILAPAGNADMLRAAVYAGADAVYLGLLHFNARRSAGNFSAAALREAAAFCHARNVKVYVTLNTTLYPGELPGLEQALRDVAAAGADALIVQDLAVARLAKQVVPSLALHGSTQMSVHSLAGAQLLRDLGFSRVILSRELTLDEIAVIAAECGIEVETFIHGALCMSVSGQCYMSAFLGGRSGNRGACAGPCRLPFSAGEPGACHLSLKDMSHIDHLPAMSGAGVASVKIEGRLRTPEYVAAAVHACVQARDGQPYDKELLQNVFSRSGFTDGYITGRRDGTMFGVRTAEDAAAARQAIPRLRELFRRERPAVPVELKLCLEEDGARLTARDEDGHVVEKKGVTAPVPAQKDPADAYRRALEKTGGTPFYAAKIELENAGAFVPAGEVNGLRRDALEELLALRQAPAPLPCTDVHVQTAAPRPAQTQGLAARFERVDQIPETLPDRVRQVWVPLEQWRQVPESLREKTWLEIPRVLFGPAEARAQEEIRASAQQGFGGYVAQNIAHFRLAQGLLVTGGFGLNVTNFLSADAYEELGARALTLSPELTCEDLARAGGGLPRLAIAYGHMPLMLTRACPLHNVHTCAGCSRQGELVDRKGVHFPVRCTGPAGARTVYNPVPIYMGDKPGALPVEWELLYFTGESADRVQQVLELFCAHAPFDGAFTRGLYFKGTQ